MHLDPRIIGRVTATEKMPTTCSTVRFWVHKDQVIRPFDIVRIKHLPRKKGGRPSYTYALVKELSYITDSSSHLANYVSYDFGDLSVEPHYERLGTTIAEAEVLYNDQEIEMPVRDGAAVEWADAEGIKDALGLRGFKEPIPAGYMLMSNGEEIPIEFEAAYLLGPEGAHLNIAGISGLATKTSYVMFLLNSIQQRLKDQVTIIIFNVKGSDLLAIDQPNPDLTPAQRSEWKKCGLDDKPLENVTYLYPFAEKPDSYYTLSHVQPDILEKQIAEGRAYNYIYDVDTGRRKLALLFSDIDDPNSTMESIAHQLPDIETQSWRAFRTEIRSRAKKGSQKAGEIPIVSWRKFVRLLETRTHHDLFTERSVTRKEEKRQTLISEAISNLRSGDVLVIDIEPLPDYLQCLVFGDVIQIIYGAKLGDEENISGERLGTVVIFADELNKYAPKSRSATGRTLTRDLLEITERGRSLGVVLFGAEQFRSGVHDRILGNCSTNIYGRTSAVEVAKCPDYAHFPRALQSAITRLPQGSLILQHAAFTTSLIKTRFPYPNYYIPRVR